MSSNKSKTNTCSLSEMLGQTSLSCVTDGIRRGYRGDRGSECLGLASGPRLSLVRLGDRLVRALASSTGVVDRGSSVDKWGSVYSSVDNGSSVNNGGSVDKRGSVNYRGSVDNRGSVSRSIGILSSSVIGDCSDVPVDGVGGVANMLGAAVREVDRVRTLSIASSVTGLSSIEVGGGGVVSYGVVVCVGGDLVRVDLSSVGNNWGVVARGSVSHNRGVVSRGCMGHYRGVVSRGSVGHNGGSMGQSRGGVSHNRGNSMANSMSSKTMTNNSMSSHDTMMTTVCSM